MVETVHVTGMTRSSGSGSWLHRRRDVVFTPGDALAASKVRVNETED
jgi:hypothetical protein